MKHILSILLLISVAFAAPMIGLELDSTDGLDSGNIFTYYLIPPPPPIFSYTADYEEIAFAKGLTVDEKVGFTRIPSGSVAYSADLTYTDHTTNPITTYDYLPFSRHSVLQTLGISFLGTDYSMIEFSATNIVFVSGTIVDFTFGKTETFTHNGKTYSINVDYDRSQNTYSISNTKCDPIYVTVTVDGMSSTVTMDQLTRDVMFGDLLICLLGPANVPAKNIKFRIGGEILSLTDGNAFTSGSDWNAKIVTNPSATGVKSIQLVYAKPLPLGGSINKIDFPLSLCTLEYKPFYKTSYLNCGSATDSEQAKVPTISNFQTSVDKDTITLSWSTDEEADSAAKCSLPRGRNSFGGEITNSDHALVTSHSLTLKAVTGGTWTCFVTSIDDAGNKVSSSSVPIKVNVANTPPNTIPITPPTPITPVISSSVYSKGPSVRSFRFGFQADDPMAGFNEYILFGIIIVGIAFCILGALKDAKSAKRLFQWK